MKRRKPTADEKIACLLIENRALRGDPIAEWNVLKEMTAHQICSLFQWHHTTYHKWVGHNHPTVLTPLYIMEHRERTAKIDNPTIAKVRRAEKRSAGKAKPKAKIRSRGFPTKEERARVKAMLEARKS